MSAGDRAPLVSVVIPAYDAQPFIAAAVASACAQTHRALEVLVVDDGSRDRTAAIVEALAARDPRVRLLRRPHRGVAAARNRAIEEARGEYIAPLDADDIWLPAKIERQLRALERAPAGTGLVYGWSADLDADGRLTGGYCAHELPPHVPAALLFRNFIGCSSVPLIRRICFERAGAYQPAYAARGAQGCEDLDLYRRIARYYEFALVREFLVGYRQTPGRMSSNALAMARSFRLALRDCGARRPAIAPRVLRWSLARQCFALHYRARGNRRYGSALALLLFSAGIDPRLLLEPEFYQALRPGRPAAGAASRRRPPPDATFAAIEAARLLRPSPLFERFADLYAYRLGVAQTLLAGAAAAPPPAPAAGRVLPAIDESRP